MKEPLPKSVIRSGKVSRKEFADVQRNPFFIILDSLKCAHNIGTIFRLADALLVEKIYICGKTIIPPNKKIKAGSRGAERWVPWEYRENVLEVVQELKQKGIFILSAEIANTSKQLKDLQISFPVCLVLGREYDGVKKELLELSDAIVHLPMLGMSNSLNVSTTASVLLYEILERHLTLQSR